MVHSEHIPRTSHIDPLRTSLALLIKSLSDVISDTKTTRQSNENTIGDALRIEVREIGLLTLEIQVASKVKFKTQQIACLYTYLILRD